MKLQAAMGKNKKRVKKNDKPAAKTKSVSMKKVISGNPEKATSFIIDNLQKIFVPFTRKNYSPGITA